MKKQIEVNYIDVHAIEKPLVDISVLLDSMKPELLEFAPWTTFPYKPGVSFTIAHTGNAILVKFYVKEKHAAAKFEQVNDHVFKDSCVEMFISFEPGKNYFNIEHNRVGACLAGYKEEGHSLQLLNKEMIEQIRTYSVIKSGLTEPEWELTVVIPIAFFGDNLQHSSLTGRTATANFYKCGDDTPIPHYLSWNLVESDAPDFHLPQFFGELIFK